MPFRNRPVSARKAISHSSPHRFVVPLLLALPACAVPSVGPPDTTAYQLPQLEVGSDPTSDIAQLTATRSTTAVRVGFELPGLGNRQDPDVEGFPDDPPEQRSKKRRRRARSQRTGAGWNSDDPHLRIIFEAGPANFEIEEVGSGDVDDSASLFRMQFDALAPIGIGGGAAFEIVGVDDDIYPGAETDLGTFDFFGYFLAMPHSRRFRMPLRAGFTINSLNQEEDSPGNSEFDQVSFGVRLEIEPEVDLVHTENFRMSIYGAFHGGAGTTIIDNGQRDDFETDNYRYGMRAGLRFRVRRFFGGVGVIYTRDHFDQSDPERVGGNQVTIPEAEFTLKGLLISGGFVF